MDMNTINSVFDVIYNYTNRNKLLDALAIKRIANIVALRWNIGEFLEDVSLEDRKDAPRRLREIDERTNSIVYATYLKLRHRIVLYFDNLEQLINSYNDVELTDKERILRANLEILNSLLHEMRHAKDRADFMHKESNELGNLLYLSSDFNSLKNKNIRKYYGISVGPIKTWKIIKNRESIYHRTYNVNPCERRADIKAAEFVVNHFKSLSHIDYPRVADIQYRNYLITLCAGYDETKPEYTCPTHEYLTEVGLNQIWKKMDFYDEDKQALIEKACSQFSLKDRLEYGLPVSGFEIGLLETKLDSVKNRIKG